jgi:hypothetical protein
VQFNPNGQDLLNTVYQQVQRDSTEESSRRMLLHA